MYLILCWSYLNHSLRFVGEKKRIQKKNCILNRNRNILVKNRNYIIFPNRSALFQTVCVSVCVSFRLHITEECVWPDIQGLGYGERGSACFFHFLSGKQSFHGWSERVRDRQNVRDTVCER